MKKLIIGGIALMVLAVITFFLLISKKKALPTNTPKTGNSTPTNTPKATLLPGKTNDKTDVPTLGTPIVSPINQAGVDTSLKVGTLLVDGINQEVYQSKTGVNLWDYYNAMGFLEDGTMVFKEVRNAGEESEYFYYYT